MKNAKNKIKKVSLFLLSSLVFLTSPSCQKDEEIEQMNAIENSTNQVSTRSGYIIGRPFTYKGAKEMFYIGNLQYNYSVIWYANGASLVSSSFNSATFEFLSTGKATIWAEIVNSYNLPIALTSHVIDIIELPDYNFLNSIKIDGPENIDAGKNAHYLLYYNSASHKIKSINWKIDNNVISNENSLNYTFPKEGTYNIICSGYFTKGDDLVPFSKTISVKVNKVYDIKDIKLVQMTEAEGYCNFELRNLPPYPDAKVTWKVEGDGYVIYDAEGRYAVFRVKELNRVATIIAIINYQGQDWKLTQNIISPPKL